MTTIAYKEGIIAYDGRAALGDGTIFTDNKDKHEESRGVHYFYAGEIHLLKHITGWWEDREYVPNLPERVRIGRAFILDTDKTLYTIVFEPPIGLIAYKIDPKQIWAIGSGCDHALTAMDMGATAKEAVKMAMLRDTGTGGKIRTFKIR